MTREEAIKLLVNATYSDEWQGNEDLTTAHNMAIEALEMVEEFEKAQIITGGRLNGRTYAYKCGLEDGKRKALEQETSKDAVSRKAMLDAITEIDENINADIYTNEVREIIRELPSVTPACNKWHLVKDGLPNEFSYVNITCRSLIDIRPDWVVETCYIPQYPYSPYSDWGNIPMLNNGECEVIAWMYRNIPEPYKAEMESKE